MKDRSTLYLACAALGLFALAAAPAPQAHDDGARAQARPGAVQRPERRTTGQDRPAGDQQLYRQPVELAESDGYHLLFGCVSDDDSGAMGLHYVNLDLYMPAPDEFDA